MRGFTVTRDTRPTQGSTTAQRAVFVMEEAFWMGRRSLPTLVIAALGAVALMSGASFAAAPWADRGWVEGPWVDGAPTLENPKHGLKVLWPVGWAVEHEEQYQSQPNVLISIKKFDSQNKVRAGVIIVSVPVGNDTAEQFFQREVAFTQKQPSFQVLMSGPAGAPGMYEMQWVLPSYKLRARNLYYVRNARGYSISLVQAADASAAELAELDKVRRFMALPEARSAAAQLPRTPAPAARLGPIVFARGMSSDVKPIDPGPKFPAGTNQIHAIFTADGLKADDILGDVLYAGTKKVLDEKKTASQVLGRAPGTHDTIAYNFSYSAGGFPAGPYRLELSINGKVVQTGTFEIAAQ
jgi:hypothetical protein